MDTGSREKRKMIGRKQARAGGKVVLLQRTDHFCVCLKYFKSGGDWPLRVGIRKPSALNM